LGTCGVLGIEFTQKGKEKCQAGRAKQNTLHPFVGAVYFSLRRRKQTHTFSKRLISSLEIGRKFTRHPIYVFCMANEEVCCETRFVGNEQRNSSSPHLPLME